MLSGEGCQSNDKLFMLCTEPTNVELAVTLRQAVSLRGSSHQDLKGILDISNRCDQTLDKTLSHVIYMQDPRCSSGQPGRANSISCDQSEARPEQGHGIQPGQQHLGHQLHHVATL